MSEILANKITPVTGTTVTLGDSGDTFTIPSGVTVANSGTATGFGKVLQVVNTQTGAVATGTTTMPNDDTIPQITEGDQYLSLAITPASTSNKLIVIVEWNGSNNTASSQLVGCLFNTAIHSTNAQAVSYCSLGGNGGTNKVSQLSMTYYLAAPSTSASTFLFRVGSHQSSTTAMNTGIGNQNSKFGGVTNSSITILEISA